MQYKQIFSNFNTRFNLPVSLFGIGAMSALLCGASLPALGESVPQFGLCNQLGCEESKYYLGYNRMNSVVLQGKELKSAQQPDTILLDMADGMTQKVFPATDERYLDHEDGSFVSSIHRIEEMRIGTLRKSELMNVHTTLKDSAIAASVKLFWGDTFMVMSSTLPKGSPVDIVVERLISGFGNPVTEHAFYQARFTTFFNGQSIEPLNFGLKREPGQGQKDQVLGKDKMAYLLRLKVGDTFTIESLMEVMDGVNVDANLHQMLNGADAVQHYVKPADEHKDVVCIQSASGRLTSGKC